MLPFLWESRRCKKIHMYLLSCAKEREGETNTKEISYGEWVERRGEWAEWQENRGVARLWVYFAVGPKPSHVLQILPQTDQTTRDIGGTKMVSKPQPWAKAYYTGITQLPWSGWGRKELAWAALESSVLAGFCRAPGEGAAHWGCHSSVSDLSGVRAAILRLPSPATRAGQTVVIW